jgi:hypothetical protein
MLEFDDFEFYFNGLRGLNLIFLNIILTVFVVLF